MGLCNDQCDAHFFPRMTEMWVCVLIGVGAFQLARLLVGLSGMATTSVMHFVLATISVISVKGFHFGRAYGTFFFHSRFEVTVASKSWKMCFDFPVFSYPVRIDTSARFST